MSQLKKIIIKIEEYGKVNGMELNKKKSAVMFINMMRTQLNIWEQKTKSILNIPIQ